MHLDALAVLPAQQLRVWFPGWVVVKAVEGNSFSMQNLHTLPKDTHETVHHILVCLFAANLRQKVSENEEYRWHKDTHLWIQREIVSVVCAMQIVSKQKPHPGFVATTDLATQDDWIQL